MKKLLLSLSVLISISVFGQGGWTRPNASHGTLSKGIGGDSAVYLPTGCGAPSGAITSYTQPIRKSNTYYDSCNKRFYLYDPKTNLWDTLHIGVSGTLSTASNGLTTSGSNIKLGGILTQNTAITGDNRTYDYEVSEIKDMTLEGSKILLQSSNTGDQIRMEDDHISFVLQNGELYVDSLKRGLAKMRLLYNPLTKQVSVSDTTSGGGTNIYNSDGTITSNRTINGGGNDVVFSGNNSMRLKGGSGSSYNELLLDAGGNAIEMESVVPGGNSGISVGNTGGITLRPHVGKLYADTLASAAGIKALRWNPTTGAITQADTTTSSGGTDNVWDSLNNPYYYSLGMKSIALKIDSVNRGTKTMNIGLIGDSRTEFNFIMAENFKEIMSGKYTMSGPGLVMGEAFTSSKTVASPTSPTLALWTVKNRTTGGKGLPLYSYVSTGSSTDFGLVANQAVQYSTFTNIDVYWFGQVAGGTFTVVVDGVTKATINTSSLTGVQKTSITGLTDSTHQLTIHPVSSGAEFLGVNLFRTSKGVRVHRIGSTGATVANYIAADSTSWSDQLRYLDNDLVFIYLGTNEVASGSVTPLFKTNMKRLINRIKAVNPLIDFCLIGQNQFDSVTWNSNIARIDSVNNYLKEIAIEDSVAFFNPNKLYGTYAQSNARGVWSDGIHQTAAGGYQLVANLINGLPTFTNTNIKALYKTAFGDTSVISPTQVANRLLFSNSSGVVGVSAALSTTTDNGITIGGNLVANNGTFAGTVLGDIVNATTKGKIGLFGFSQNQNLISAGYTSGARTNTDGSISFQTTNQGAVVNNFSISNFAAVPRDWNQSSNIFLIDQGWGNGAASTNINTFSIQNIINQTTAISGIILRGIYYNPTLTSLTGITHRAIETTTGDVIFGSTSGNVGIGTASPSSRLHIIDNSITTTSLIAASSSSLTTGSLMSLTNTGTAAASNTKNVLAIVSSGANGTASQTVTGQTISVTNTGTTNKNVGLSITASGATTNNSLELTGHVVFPTDNTYDIGANGSTRPRSVYTSGAIFAGSYIHALGSGGLLLNSFGSILNSSADGVFKLSNNAQTDFTRLQLGGTTSSFPAISRNGTGIDIKLADNSAYTTIRASQHIVAASVFWSSGTGSPEGVLTANIGSLYSRTDGGAGTSLYVKESGTGNTGWVAK